MKFSQMEYERVNVDEALQDLMALERKQERADSGDEAFDIHKHYYALQDQVLTQMTIAEIRHDIDMTDAFYDGENAYYNEKRPELENRLVSYQKALYHSPHREALEKKIGKVAFRNMELAFQAVDERIVPLMAQENSLANAYNKLLATAKIDWEGEEKNLSLMTPYLKSADRSVRIRAWEKYSAFFAAHAEELDDLYDRLVKNRTRQAEMLGYGNYLPLGDARMRRNCYSRDDMRAFRRQVREQVVPYTQALQETRRRRLGLGSLSYVDEGVYFPAGNPQPTGTPEQILAAGQRMYRELSEETGAFMDFMCENELFDVLGRKTKKTGGYMTYLPDYKAPFIFANFNGTSGDVDVMTHECGHAFQGYLAAQDPIREHADITMETAETHSMSMEYFTEPWMHLFFGQRAADYVQMHDEDSLIFIPYGTMVDAFQEIVYENPGLTPKARNEVWQDLERQYRPHMDYTGNAYFESGAFWQKQHHIYDNPLYYLDYCIAETDALQYRIWMKRDYRQAWDSYLKLCRLSASDFFTRMLPEVGLIVPFEDGALRHIIGKLQ